jgi:hypothetical protein
MEPAQLEDAVAAIVLQVEEHGGLEEAEAFPTSFHFRGIGSWAEARHSYLESARFDPMLNHLPSRRLNSLARYHHQKADSDLPVKDSERLFQASRTRRARDGKVISCRDNPERCLPKMKQRRRYYQRRPSGTTHHFTFRVLHIVQGCSSAGEDISNISESTEESSTESRRHIRRQQLLYSIPGHFPGGFRMNNGQFAFVGNQSSPAYRY